MADGIGSRRCCCVEVGVSVLWAWGSFENIAVLRAVYDDEEMRARRSSDYYNESS